MSWRICAGFDFDRRTDKADDGYDAARVAHEVGHPKEDSLPLSIRVLNRDLIPGQGTCVLPENLCCGARCHTRFYRRTQ